MRASSSVRLLSAAGCVTCLCHRRHGSYTCDDRSVLCHGMSAMSDNVLRECRYGLYVQVHNYVDMIVCLLVAT